jgi:hypothetical protein
MDEVVDFLDQLHAFWRSQFDALSVELDFLAKNNLCLWLAGAINLVRISHT